ncbi:erythroblast NAD(P)(+)--arginine ADP-ribosyltransferase-like [Halichoeres trimaculatus]|uniref:erythroblast NAD(P)(+)--arginine ADP-ribosyltransferase-like n=1 Tax=Halichoeres trimaculatus TaxID=147232 RepID=UPI003D9E1E89
MKRNILHFAPVLLIFCVQPLLSKTIISSTYEEAVPLSMVPDSVDDMYSDCREEMEKKVKHVYLPKEHKGKFEKAWRNAEKCARRNLKLKDKEDKLLTKEHFQAICLYTSGYLGFYGLFNTAVQTKRAEYSTTFQFHSLHFWLTSAIQILHSNRKCFTSYRRSKTEFTGKENQMIRFGFFTSSSKSAQLRHFGDTSCFEIKTCYGAYLKKYPHLKDKEEEVLIPPYEMFKISKITRRLGNLSDCKTVYVLESVGFCSTLNCQAAKLDQ